MLPTYEYFIIVAKRGRVLGATACHSHIPACSQDKHKEPGLFLGLVTLVAQNSVLGMMDFPAAFTWVWTDCWGCAGSEHSLKTKGFNYVEVWERWEKYKSRKSCELLYLSSFEAESV